MTRGGWRFTVKIDLEICIVDERGSLLKVADSEIWKISFFQKLTTERWPGVMFTLLLWSNIHVYYACELGGGGGRKVAVTFVVYCRQCHYDDHARPLCE